MNIPITLLKNKNGGYTVISNILNFITEGDTLEEALKNAQEAAECHIEGLKKDSDTEEKDYLRSIDTSFNTFVTV